MSDEWYDTAQVCINGHVATSMLESSPSRASNFCEECGVKTISRCEKCNSPIRGHHNSPPINIMFEYVPPKHCWNCGKAYPWTERNIQALMKKVQEFEEISAGDASGFQDSVADIVMDTHKTRSASMQMKSLIAKMTSQHQDAIKDMLAKIACEAAKAHILG